MATSDENVRNGIGVVGYALPEVRNVINANVQFTYQTAQQMKELIADAGNSNAEIVAARTDYTGQTYLTIGDRADAQDITLSQKIDKGSISVTDINKNAGKIDQTYLSDGLLQQIAGTAPINAVPADNSLTKDKYADKSVAFSKRTAMGTFGFISTGNVVNIDLANSKIVLPTDAYVIYVGTSVKVGDVTISLSGASGFIFFNISTKTFHTGFESAAVEADDIILGAYFTSYGTAYLNTTRYTVNGQVNFADKAITTAKINDQAATFSKRTEIGSFAVLQSSGGVNIDTANRTISFGGDGYVSYGNKTVLITSAKIDNSGAATGSGHYVYYDIPADKIRFTANTNNIPERAALIGIIWWNSKRFSFVGETTIDGNPSKNITDYVQKTVASTTGKLPRPASGITYFTVDVNADLSYLETENVTTVQDGENTLSDDGILWLPDNYSQTGKPLKLVIFCHGSGETIDSNRTALPNPFNYLLNGLGYAVMDMNGIPKSTSGGNGIHFGSPLALQSYLKGYKYVIDNFNIDPNGCFVSGMSVGGLAAFSIIQSGVVPVLASGIFCPVTDIYKQAWLKPWSTNQRANIAKYFNFDGWDIFSGFTETGDATQEEIDYFFSNIDKVIGYNPMMKNSINWTSINPYEMVYNSSEEEASYRQVNKYHQTPLKIWHNADDATVSPRYSDFMVSSIRNTGGLAYLRTFPSGGHNAWDNGDTISTTDYKGNAITTKASGYELGLWFDRFL